MGEIKFNGRALTAEELSRLKTMGWVFVVIGALAIIWPVVATIAVSQLVAWLLVFSGVSGLIMWWRLRHQPGALLNAVTAALGLVVGVIFLVHPFVGASTLTMMLAALFLVEAFASIMLAFAMRAHSQGWVWLLFSGLTALLMAVLIFAGWPGTAVWILGLLFGFNLLSTGISMLMISRTV